METGEVVIKAVIDTLQIESTNMELVYDLIYNDGSIRLEMKGENEFNIFYPEFILTFRRIMNLEDSKFSLKQYEEYIIGNTLIEADPITNTRLGDLSKTYLSTGIAKYDKIGSNSKWESAFAIIEFEGFVFLKGISSAPIILIDIDEHIIKGIEADYRFIPKEMYLGRLTDLSTKVDLGVEKPFRIEPIERSNYQCVSQLPEDLLDLEISIAKGITEKQITTIQVQHSYECRWMLFHEADFDGFAKASIRELINIDSSLCHIFEIPCGYYAERESKKGEWYIYLHEDRIETDSSYITKKAFKWNNTYRIINELKDEDIIHYQDYNLDSRILKKTWTYLNGKEIGVTRFYDEKGVLKEEIKN